MKRSINEDAALATELPGGGALLAVADGVGGMAHGDQASQKSLESLQSYLLREGLGDPPRALAGAYAAINKEVWETGSSMATTLVVAMIAGARAWIGNVGDSRAYLLASGELRQLTQDHSWVAEQVAAGAITQAEARASKYRHVITRAIGAEASVQPDLEGPIDLPSPCTILLCSDGLYRVIDGPTLTEFAQEGSAAVICQRLVHQANARGGPDNIAVAVLKYTA